MAFGAADLPAYRVGDIVPRRGERGDHAGSESDDRFPGFVAIGVTCGAVVETGCYGSDFAEEPDEDVQTVRAEVAESADARLLRIGHPAPLLVEPAGERAAVTDA